MVVQRNKPKYFEIILVVIFCDTRVGSSTMPRVIHIDKEDAYVNQISNKEGGLVSPGS